MAGVYLKGAPTRQPGRISVLPSDFDRSTRQKPVRLYGRDPSGRGSVLCSGREGDEVHGWGIGTGGIECDTVTTSVNTGDFERRECDMLHSRV